MKRTFSRMLRESVLMNDTARARELLEKGADCGWKDEYGYTPLHYACIRGNPDMVELLVAHSDDLDVPNPSGNTPLMKACFWDQADIVRILLSFGADCRQRNRRGHTAIDIARHRKDRKIVRILKEWNHVMPEMEYIV